MTVREYCIEIKQLLLKVGEVKYVDIFDFLIDELQHKFKDDLYHKILELYGGMLSLNDFVLHKDGVPLQAENDEFQRLINGLHEATIIEIQKLRSLNDLETRRLISILGTAIEKYTKHYCPCSYPRFIQIVSIDCLDYKKSFQSFETEIMIEKARPFYEVEEIKSKEEAHAERWTCKKCASVFDYYWSDLSINFSRATLKPIDIHAKTIGLPAIKPIPLVRGLLGHSFPPETEIVPVTRETFGNYLLLEPAIPPPTNREIGKSTITDAIPE